MCCLLFNLYCLLFFLCYRTCLSRVDRLKNLIRKKKIENSKDATSASSANADSKKKKDSNDDSNEDEDEEDIEDMFNWRAKMA